MLRKCRKKMKNNLNNNQQISLNCWLWFMNNNQGELYEVISAMIDTKIKEQLPQIVEEQLRQKIDGLSFDIQTTLNGKSSADFRQIITDEIIREMKK